MKPANKIYNASNNNHGIAMLLVMSSLVFLTILLATFSYETELNRIRTSAIQEKLNAKLNAESGLNFALAKIRIYQSLINRLEKNKKLKSIVKPAVVENLIFQPFIYPIEISEGMNIIQKTAIQEFQEDTLIQGSVIVTINKVSGFLNPNNMAIIRSKRVRKRYVYLVGEKRAKRDLTQPVILIEEHLVDLMTKLIEDKKSKDELFASRHKDISPFNLIQELRFYVTDKKNVTHDTSAFFQPIYEQAGIIPKHAPLNSIDELYQLVGWSDEIVDLIKDHLTVHESSTIQVNDITENQLRNIFPDIEEEQVKEFFIYRDGNEELEEEPNPFLNVTEFKSFLTNNLGLSEAVYEQRVEELAMAGIQFDTTGKLYKVVSTGLFNRAKYKITAFVDLPIKPPPPPPPPPIKTLNKKSKKDKKGKKNKKKNTDQNKRNIKKEKQPRTLLKPRVVEIQIN